MRAYLNKVGQRLGRVKPAALQKVEIGLKHLLVNKLNLRLDSVMMVSVPEHWSRQSADKKLGTNRNFVKAVMKVVSQKPEMSDLVVSKFEDLFDLACNWDHNPRELVALVYIMMTNPRIDRVPKSPVDLVMLLDDICWHMDEFAYKGEKGSFDVQMNLIIRQGLAR